MLHALDIKIETGFSLHRQKEKKKKKEGKLMDSFGKGGREELLVAVGSR